MRLSFQWSKISKLWSQYNLSGVAIDISQLVGRNLISLIVSLGVAKLLTSVFTREEYGIYQFVIGIVASLGFLSLPGMNQIIIQETAKGKHGMLSQALRWQLKVSPIYSAVILILAGYYQFIAKETVIALCFAATFIFFPLKSAISSYLSYLLGRQDYTLYTRLPLFVSLGVALTTALTAWATRNPVVVLAAFGITATLLHLFGYGFVLKNRPPENTDYSQSAIHFGLSLSALYITPSISARLGTILVGTLLSMPEVALLSLMFLPLQKSKILLGPLLEFLSPRVVTQSGPNMFRRANQAMLIYVTIMLGFVILVAAMMPVFFRIFFPDYMDAMLLARLAIFCMLPSAPAGIMELTIYSQKRLTQTRNFRFIQFAFDLVITYVCIRTWGVVGSILSRFLSGSLRTSMVSIYYFKNRRQALQNPERFKNGTRRIS